MTRGMVSEELAARAGARMAMAFREAADAIDAALTPWTGQGESLGRAIDRARGALEDAEVWAAVAALTEGLRWYARGSHIGRRDSSDMRVDGDEVLRDRGDRAVEVLGRVWGHAD